MRRPAFSVVLLVLGCFAALSTGCGQSEPATVASRTTTPTDHRARSIAAAVQFLSDRVDVAVVVPTNLPVGTELAGDPSVNRTGAQLTLALPRHRFLTIQYGKASFDGCGPLHPRRVTVARIPAVIDTSTSHGRPFTTLVWPATLKNLEGRYGLSGQFTAAQILAFANSMQRARSRTPRGPKNGC
jgi:hypothetical protein